MLSSLTSGVSGLESFQQQMDVIGNNIANINTNGFKAATVNFADTFSNSLQGAGGAATSSPETVAQVGTGVSISGINNNWSAGALSSTGIPSNVALTGNGFFLVKDTVSGNTYATRDGSFSVNSSGFLVNDNGDFVQGITTPGSTTVGNLQISLANAVDSTGAADPSPISSYSIDGQGNINVIQQDNNKFVAGQIVLQNFQDPQQLISEGNNLYSNLTAAGPLAAPVTPGASGTGGIKSGVVELSNVDLSNEMANLITAQRAFEANSKIITTSNEVLQTVVNMKQG